MPPILHHVSRRAHSPAGGGRQTGEAVIGGVSRAKVRSQILALPPSLLFFSLVKGAVHTRVGAPGP